MGAGWSGSSPLTPGGHFRKADAPMCLLGQEPHGDLSRTFQPGMVVSGEGSGKSRCGVQKGGGVQDLDVPSRDSRLGSSHQILGHAPEVVIISTHLGLENTVKVKWGYYLCLFFPKRFVTISAICLSFRCVPK